MVEGEGNQGPEAEREAQGADDLNAGRTPEKTAEGIAWRTENQPEMKLKNQAVAVAKELNFSQAEINALRRDRDEYATKRSDEIEVAWNLVDKKIGEALKEKQSIIELPSQDELQRSDIYEIIRERLYQPGSQEEKSDDKEIRNFGKRKIDTLGARSVGSYMGAEEDRIIIDFEPRVK